MIIHKLWTTLIVTASALILALLPAGGFFGSQGQTVMNLRAWSSGSFIQLNWDPNEAEEIAGYNVYRSTSDDGAWTRLNDAPFPLSSFVDFAPPDTEAVYYRVVPISTGGGELDVGSQIEVSLPSELRLEGEKWKGVRAAGFDINFVVSDEEFTDANAMTLDEIQKFLHSQGSALTAFETDGLTAAEHIFNAAQAHGINPRVLLVMLQLHHGLITNSQPDLAKINRAMNLNWGNAAFQNFADQINYGTQHLRDYYDNPIAYGLTINEPIEVSDGTVTPANAATSALYGYIRWIGELGRGRKGVGGASLFWVLSRESLGAETNLIERRTLTLKPKEINIVKGPHTFPQSRATKAQSQQLNVRRPWRPGEYWAVDTYPGHQQKNCPAEGWRCAADFYYADPQEFNQCRRKAEDGRGKGVLPSHDGLLQSVRERFMEDGVMAVQTSLLITRATPDTGGTGSKREFRTWYVHVQTLETGAVVFIYDEQRGGLDLRNCPTTEQVCPDGNPNTSTLVSNWTRATVVEGAKGPVPGDPHIWWKIRLDNGSTGWAFQATGVEPSIRKERQVLFNSIFKLGDRVVVYNDDERAKGLNLRPCHRVDDTACPPTLMANWTKATIIDGPFREDNHTWWKLRLDDGQSGWAVEALNDPPNASSSSQPTLAKEVQQVVQVIANVSDLGWARSPHLHFAVQQWDDSKKIWEFQPLDDTGPVRLEGEVILSSAHPCRGNLPSDESPDYSSMPRALSVSLTANPSSGAAPLKTTLTANVAGTATGTINYTFWWNCDDPGTDVEAVMALPKCGSISTPNPGTCERNANGLKCNAVNDDPMTVNYHYLIPGDYTAKVIVERGSAFQAEARVPIKVTGVGIVGWWSFESAKRVVVHNRYAYVVSGSNKITVIDVGDPASPTKVRDIGVDSPGDIGCRAEDIVGRGSYLYVVTDCALNSHLLIIDVEEPKEPIGDWGLGWGSFKSVFVDGDFAYIADEMAFPVGGLHIVNVRDPRSPWRVGEYSDWWFGGFRRVSVSGSRAYVISGENVLVFDVTDKENPQYLGGAVRKDRIRPEWIYAVSSSRVYVTYGNSGLAIIDLSDPRRPDGVGDLDTPGFAQFVQVGGPLAYVADGSAGVRVIDVSNPASPKEGAAYDTPGEAMAVYASQGFIYVADGGSGLVILRFVGGT